MLEIVQLILITFEHLSGLKINFSKSEIIPINITEDDGQQLANMLGCKIELFTYHIFRHTVTLEKVNF